MLKRLNLLFLVLCISMLSCKMEAQEKGQSSAFDFSTVKAYRDTKQNGTVVNDYYDVLTATQMQALSSQLVTYADETTRQIVIVTVNDIATYTNIQEFGSDLANYWGVGNAEKDNGLLIVLCNPERKIAICTGYGTEQKISDPYCKEVIDSIMIPQFKNGDFYTGIQEGVNALIKKWDE